MKQRALSCAGIVLLLIISSSAVAQEPMSEKFAVSDGSISINDLVLLTMGKITQKNSVEDCSLGFDVEKPLSLDAMATVLLCLHGERHKDTSEALRALETYVALPHDRSVLGGNVTRALAVNVIDCLRAKQWSRGRVSRRLLSTTAQRNQTWQSYENSRFGFGVDYPPEMHAEYDVQSDAVRFLLWDNNRWESGWAIWHNLKNIQKFRSMDAVIRHIRPDDMDHRARRTVTKRVILIDGHRAHFVTVRVTGDRAEPWVYRIVFLNLGAHMYEISAQTTKHPGFERFVSSFHLLAKHLKIKEETSTQESCRL